MSEFAGFWVYGNQISGSSSTWISPEQWAIGFRLVPAPSGLEIEDCYWDSIAEEIKVKPDRPSPQHYWDTQSNQWTLPPTPPAAPITPDWKRLENELRGSILFQKGYGAAERTLKANAAFTLLTNALTTTHNLNDLKFAFSRLREALSGISAIGDFTSEELETIASKLMLCNFDPSEFDLSEHPSP